MFFCELQMCVCRIIAGADVDSGGDVRTGAGRRVRRRVQRRARRDHRVRRNEALVCVCVCVCLFVCLSELNIRSRLCRTYAYVERELPRVPLTMPILVVGNHRDMGHHRQVPDDKPRYFLESLHRFAAQPFVSFRRALMSIVE